jgi:regulator of replication initiation timing
MRVRKTFLILYLATGLSVGLLSSCNPFSKSQEQPPASSTGTSNQPVTDNQQTPAITNLELEELIKKRAALNTFVANIKVTEKQTKVENPVDYAEAKKIVDELANAYKTFKDSLSNDIKTKIGFNNIDSKIEPILEGTSQQRKILEDLAKSQYREAQTKLSQLEINSRRIYQSNIDGQDGSKQRIATKKLLEQILNVTQPLATLKIDNSSTQNPTNSNSPTNSLTTNDLKIQLEQLKKDINRNNWVWPLFNTLALLSVPISFIFLWDMMRKIVLIHKVQTRGIQETNIQKFRDEIVTIKSNLQETSNELTKYLKNNKSEEELTSILGKIDVVKHELERIYHDVILQHLDTLDPTQDLIKIYTEGLSRNLLTSQENFSFKQLGDFNTKLDKLLQISQPNQSPRSSSENSTTLDQILHLIQPLESQSQNLIHEIEQLKHKLVQKNENIDFKSVEDKLDYLLRHFQENFRNLATNFINEHDERRKQLEPFNSGEVEQLRQQNQQLSSSSQDLEKLLEIVNDEKVNLQQQATTLESRVHKLQQDKKDLESTANENVEEIQKLKTEIERLRKRVNKEAIETEDISQQWQNIINSYNKSPDAIFRVNGVKKEGEVVEDIGERRSNSSMPVVLTSDMSPDGFYIVSVGNDYLLFPKQNAIAPSQKFTASALFDGYRSGDTRKFTLISPAQVTPVGGGGRWQLKYKGRLEYN